jgi:hypothetical protein
MAAAAGGKTVGLGEGASRGTVALGGRDPAVLIAREMLYRACELSINLNLNTADALRLHRDVLDAIVKVSGVQTGTGSSALADTPAAPQMAAPTPGTPQPAASAPASSGIFGGS